MPKSESYCVSRPTPFHEGGKECCLLDINPNETCWGQVHCSPSWVTVYVCCGHRDCYEADLAGDDYYPEPIDP